LGASWPAPFVDRQPSPYGQEHGLLLQFLPAQSRKLDDSALLSPVRIAAHQHQILGFEFVCKNKIKGRIFKVIRGDVEDIYLRQRPLVRDQKINIRMNFEVTSRQGANDFDVCTRLTQLF
jgi:hypothetical protein